MSSHFIIGPDYLTFENYNGPGKRKMVARVRPVSVVVVITPDLISSEDFLKRRLLRQLRSRLHAEVDRAMDDVEASL